MEGLLIALGIIWTVVNFIRKAAKQKERQQEQGGPGEARPAPQPRPVVKHSVWEQITEMIEEGVSDNPSYRASTTNVPWRDEEGCIGGSLAHTTHEGSTLSGYTTHEGSALSGSTGYIPTNAYVPVERSIMDEAVMEPEHRWRVTGEDMDMRRAVIMAELLAKPVAMRGKRQINGGMAR